METEYSSDNFPCSLCKCNEGWYGLISNSFNVFSYCDTKSGCLLINFLAFFKQLSVYKISATSYSLDVFFH